MRGGTPDTHRDDRPPAPGLCGLSPLGPFLSLQFGDHEILVLPVPPQGLAKQEWLWQSEDSHREGCETMSNFLKQTQGPPVPLIPAQALLKPCLYTSCPCHPPLAPTLSGQPADPDVGVPVYPSTGNHTHASRLFSSIFHLTPLRGKSPWPQLSHPPTPAAPEPGKAGLQDSTSPEGTCTPWRESLQGAVFLFSREDVQGFRLLKENDGVDFSPFTFTV